jgi:SulP family sulfate permease
VRRYTPALLDTLREGVTSRALLRDALAGLTVAIIALPLAMAFGIASIPEHVAAELAAAHPWLTPPAMGIFTAIVGGFLISALGGSRVQIGGPTGAFIVIVYAIASEHGYAGLATATLMAGVIVIIMGFARFGAVIKFIPYPVTTGFTTGIAVIIATSQFKDFLGLRIEGGVPAEFVGKLQAYARHIETVDPATVALAAASLAALIVFRRLAPRLPAAIITLIGAALAVRLLGLVGLEVETIGSRFGDMPRALPRPHLPNLALARELIPEATTIAILCAIESLLSAVVADGITGDRHKADAELVAQGAANIGAAMFWGIPATGAIARTVANIKSGGSTPVAGIVHAAALLLILLIAAPLAKAVPLATLAAILLMVAWNMSELDHFRTLLRAPRSDIATLLTTFGLTVFTDLTIAVGVGVVLASLLFMRRMAEVTGMGAITRELTNGEYREDRFSIHDREVPRGCEVYEINGPFFFGVADRLADTLSEIEPPPKVFILRMRHVPAMDASGAHALDEFAAKCRRHHTKLILSAVQRQPRKTLERFGLIEKIGPDNLQPDIDAALARARELLDQKA